MRSFESDLKTSIKKNIGNNYGEGNYNELRYGSYKSHNKSTESSIKNSLRSLLYNLFDYRSKNIDVFIKRYNEKLQFLWEKLNDQDKAKLVQLIAYRILGFEKVRLYTNTDYYHQQLDHCQSLIDDSDIIDPKFMHFKLYKMNLSSLGTNIFLYSFPYAIVTMISLKQYSYRIDKEKIISVEPGDIALDCGGCWGDTAIYFADKVGSNGKVYSFEFIPNNLDIFHRNLELNPTLKERVEIVPFPLGEESDHDIYFKDKGPGSIVSLEPFEGQTGATKTISIDELVKRKNLSQLNFIKMDIEGSELSALKGAEQSIKKFKPKLAISIYHSLEDFYSIPNWILTIEPNYELFLDHATIHSEETVLFAKYKDKL
jgi:FkbM family methyltransferase